MTATLVSEPTVKQLGFLNKLLDEAQHMLSERERITGCEWPEAAEAVARMRERLADGRTRKEVSTMIDTALDNNKQLKAELTGRGYVPGAVRKPEHEPQTFVGEGMYTVDGRIFKVLPSRSSDRHYAKELTGEGESYSFTYAPGAMRLIRPEHRMTEAQAREFGRTTGHCCVCARLLTDPKSIEAGIGPVCSGKR